MSDKIDIAALTAQFKGLASDSRAVTPGDLFVAVPGVKSDGAAFVADAVAHGAKGVLGRPGIEPAVRAAGAAFVAADNPRLCLANLAAAFFAPQPETVAAVTGTNGKTSATVFLREIWTALGYKAASLGTIGVVSPEGDVKLSNTTPGPVELHSLLRDLALTGVDRVAMEASSHGLDQHRLDGVKVAAAGFTNITRDHMDYHRTFADYLGAKRRLFSDILSPGGTAVVNADAEYAGTFLDAAAVRGAKIFSVGEKGEGLRLTGRTLSADGQRLSLLAAGRAYDVFLPLIGAFQASNALVAAGLAVALGDTPEAVFSALPQIKGAPGRMEKVAVAACGAPVVVDYAHTPDALEVVLQALRPHTAGRLIVVFGCGGDRDRGKRPLMGRAAAAFADAVVVTDDNPRSEDPAAIRAEALAGCPGALEIGDRAEAIGKAVSLLQTGDLLVIAGKGHETGQIVNGVVHPFSDREVAVKAALASGGRA